MSRRTARPALPAMAPRPLRLRMTAGPDVRHSQAATRRTVRTPSPSAPTPGVSLRRDLVRHLRHDGGLWTLGESHLWPDGPCGRSLALAMAAYAGPGRDVLAINADPEQAGLARLAPDASWHTLPRYSSEAVDPAASVEAIDRYDPGVVLLGRTSPGAPPVPARVVDTLIEAASGLVIIDEGGPASLDGSALALLTERPELFVHRTVPRPIARAHRLPPGLGYLAGTPHVMASIAYQSSFELPIPPRRAPRAAR